MEYGDNAEDDNDDATAAAVAARLDVEARRGRRGNMFGGGDRRRTEMRGRWDRESVEIEVREEKYARKRAGRLAKEDRHELPTTPHPPGLRHR